MPGEVVDMVPGKDAAAAHVARSASRSANVERSNRTGLPRRSSRISGATMGVQARRVRPRPAP